MSVNKFKKYNSPEYKIVKQIIDPYLAYIVEEYLISYKILYYYDENIAIKYRLKGKEKDGLFEHFHINGMRLETYFFKLGKQHGEYKKWYENGQLQEQRFFKDGIPIGECKWWHKNGQIGLHFFYENGEKCNYKKWNENGEIIEQN